MNPISRVTNFEGFHETRVLSRSFPGKPETWSKQQIFVCLCDFGAHHVGTSAFRSLATNKPSTHIMPAPVDIWTFGPDDPLLAMVFPGKPCTWTHGQIFISYCKFGGHSRARKPKYFKTLQDAIMKAPLDLSGDLWVQGRAARLVKSRLRVLLRGIDTRGGMQYREKSLNNFTARLRALEARR
ncbi:hypothetical protein JMJ35_008200 [Cladonia borealis]|uniref:Uncharacterized protein n=1 Tax=Cladonia borealis TaxID=184061 RepID=A0AA39QWQ6_9LECA|nr:hypothetical protein JMJ35_008200 [Cladonia borealis]